MNKKVGSILVIAVALWFSYLLYFIIMDSCKAGDWYGCMFFYSLFELLILSVVGFVLHTINSL